MCVDYRKLNKLTVFDHEPMPAAVDLFQKLKGDKFFSKIDLSKGYWQVTIPEVDIPKTAFVTPDGSYEFLKMPFGMVNSAATLKRGMKKLLRGMKNVEFYWDDILVHTRTWEEHLKILRELCRSRAQAGKTIRPSKNTLPLALKYASFYVLKSLSIVLLLMGKICRKLFVDVAFLHSMLWPPAV